MKIKSIDKKPIDILPPNLDRSHEYSSYNSYDDTGEESDS